jgi:hypothetical protein
MSSVAEGLKTFGEGAFDQDRIETQNVCETTVPNNNLSIKHRVSASERLPRGRAPLVDQMAPSHS